MAEKKTKGGEEGIVVKVKFSDGQTFAVDINDLTSREQVTIEEFFDRPFPECIDSGWLLQSHKGLILLATIARRRAQPDWSYDQTLDSFDELVESDESRPTAPSKESGSPS